MNVRLSGITWLVTCFLVACAGPQASYLEGHVNKATQEDVRQALGKPSLTKALEGGGSEWLYHYFVGQLYSELVEGKVHANHPDCTEYLLTFDERKVLSDWRKQDCE